jgi:hypothetical protein
MLNEIGDILSTLFPSMRGKEQSDRPEYPPAAGERVEPVGQRGTKGQYPYPL